MTGHETHKSHLQGVRYPACDVLAGQRFEGCLLGGAVGDALGAPVEFMPGDEIVRRFGRDGITEYVPAYGRIGAITDDTQMTLFTGEGLLRAWVRGCLKGVSTYSGVTSHAYLRWLLTQGVKPANKIMIETGEMGWLFRQPELHHRRAPGNTCLSALRETESLGQPAKNSSKGCGGVMRVAPVGLFGSQNMSAVEVFDLGTELAALTHGHPTGSLTAGCLAAMVHALVHGQDLRGALDIAKQILIGKVQHEETLHAIEAAERLAKLELPCEAAIAELGEGWVAEEALAISVYCALVAKDFRDGIILAVNHDGDSDSTGSITGNLLGAILGVTAIPSHWLDGLELRSVIAELAGDLYRYREWDMSDSSLNNHFVQQVWEKYPGF